MNVFDLMTHSERSSLYAVAKLQFLEAGKTLFEHGDKAEHFYLVNRGLMKAVRITATGEEKVFNLFQQDSVIAEISMFMPDGEYPMTAIAETNCQLAVFHKKDLHNLVNNSPILANKFMALISQRVSNLLDTIDTLTQVNADQRLVMFFAQQYAQQRPNNHSIMLNMPKKVLASQLSIKPETLSRILKKLKDKRLVLENNHRFHFPDIDALCKEVDIKPRLFYKAKNYEIRP